MPDFAKNPKVIAATVVILWLAYVIYANFQLDPIKIKIFPFVAYLEFKVSAVIIGAILFGVIATLVFQFFWNRRSSKNGKQTMVA